jgi:ABC-type branched-subunit amino acid transport system ATPase component
LPEPLLQVEGLRAGYGDVDIVRGASLAVGEGELVVLIGPNGAGKSTLLKAVFGLLKVRAGSVLLAGQDLAGQGPEHIARQGLGYVPQVANVFPTMTVKENLELGGYLRKDGAKERMEELLGEFPRLRERLRQPAGTLSGGERQMLALAKALMLDPRCLLLDEPSAGLAPAVVDEVFQRVRGIVASGVGVAMVEQNAKKALALADRGYVLDKGENAFEGPGPALLANPDVGRLYLGIKPAAAPREGSAPPR